ncbi:putative alpha-glucan synthase ags2 [Phaeomoniella chlamydospora]|uniref:alpha-1,3-glucan synthase n=1 Tax=Phaeomoniella chlamydospora TaxID=158046 RepID=A0A0G2EBL8_PHACM|nr:putative alpha-glucan synthase ags2 [Phaeomoniella chlamydospora]
MRDGGDLQGLLDTLDYLHGMGIRGIYLAGPPLINQPWGADGYSILDHSLLDFHYGTLKLWRKAITEIHERGMYVVMDNTMGTMGNLLGFKGYFNTSTPFTVNEHHVQWVSSRRYLDFDFSNDYNETCDYPAFWKESGYPVSDSVNDRLTGCYNSEFDQYGDVEAFGVFPNWERQLSRFASVQDRLREWHPPVREKLQTFGCIYIASLDVDGFRYDKATQATVDALSEYNHKVRQCARRFGKKNFFLPGEITLGNTFGATYIGRGRQPDMLPNDTKTAISLTVNSSDKYFIRDAGYVGLDSAAFHYSVYRYLERFLGMNGDLTAAYDTPSNWVDAWNEILITNDLINAETGVFDPRHMFGTLNQDLFRWPAIEYGTRRQLLGNFITTIHMPGIPLLLWGEEQAFYVLDNTADNYIYGRSPMSSSLAWQTHGCYSLDPYSSQFYKMPIESAADGCHDDWISQDHRDPTHPVRNILKRMYHLRDVYPVLNDGVYLEQLSNMTSDLYYVGSSGTATETGLWSTVRSAYSGVQDFSDQTYGNQSIWLVYTNENHTRNFEFDCTDDSTVRETTALLSPFSTGTVVKNLFYPYDEQTLSSSKLYLGLDGSAKASGCLSNLTMDAWEFRAYVPIDSWVEAIPMLTNFSPGHDKRLLSNVSSEETETITVELEFSTEMDCDDVTSSITFNSTSSTGSTPSIDESTISCGNMSQVSSSELPGEMPSTWIWTAELTNVAHGIHQITVNNATSSAGVVTNSTDHLMFRIGASDNPIVFPRSANYSSKLLYQYDNGSLYVSQKAPGADKWRYSTNFGSSFSDWLDYTSGNITITENSWTGTDKQKWKGKHVRVEYWNRIAGSSDHVQEGDLNWDGQSRRWPHMFLAGDFNQYGYDSGLSNEFKQNSSGAWNFHFMTEWPTTAQVNIWGMNPDKQPDQTYVFGDANNDHILDRQMPNALESTVINITSSPPRPYLAWRIAVDDANMSFALYPAGSEYLQMGLFFLLWIVPPITGVLLILVFMQSFYKVKFNKKGVTDRRGFHLLGSGREKFNESFGPLMTLVNKSGLLRTSPDADAVATDRRRMVLIATIEYEIEDWDVKIKIGGLGVMAQLMAKHLGHEDLIWVVPCVGGVNYPFDQPAEPITVTILGNAYEIAVQYHVVRNITYVLLDAPVFRQQTKTDPYPARMDDLDSAIYYSAWNQSIAAVIKRFPVDIYHINDYHGSLAPIYLLPGTVPACLSLHNAEFQGLWPIRTDKELEEVCSVFNLLPTNIKKYVQFGQVFNMLHAGVSYLRIHQHGFGAVGVSKKYGKRSYARYPIFWGLKKIGNLPNPDPTDTGEWNQQTISQAKKGIQIDPEFESKKGEWRKQAQEWAGLSIDPSAELFVFVGRWSMQKGVDLIADVFPSVLEAHSNVQLLCVGPVIDLYGKFAALKLQRMMELYPGRVFAKPEFTALPPFIFSGAEFALIPSRDEPFGLVAVEFGRKGALGVGARVGGLGQMPGWWYTVESTSTSHLQTQFKLAIKEALSSKTKTRAMMRARSARQRFPVVQWITELNLLQSTAIRVHHNTPQTHLQRDRHDSFQDSRPQTPSFVTSMASGPGTRASSFSGIDPTVMPSHTDLRTQNPEMEADAVELDGKTQTGLRRKLSLGVRYGPGALAPPERGRNRSQSRNQSVIMEFDNETAERNALRYDDADDEYDPMASYYGQEEYIMPYNGVPAQRYETGDAVITPLREPTLPVLFDPSRPLPSPGFQDGLSPPATPGATLLPPRPSFLSSHNQMNRFSSASTLSVDMVVGDKKDYNLQEVVPVFTDSTGEFTNKFSTKLADLSGANSEDQLCIEQYLEQAEKKWFERFRKEKLKRRQSSASLLSMGKNSKIASPLNSDHDGSDGSGQDEFFDDEFHLSSGYKPPTGIKRFFLRRIGDWPVYSIFMALGQIISANSYQVTLLSGQVGETATKLYAIAVVYLIASIVWWLSFRQFKAVVSLSVPFLFYGLAFVIIGVSPFISDGRTFVRNLGLGFYSFASASGSVFFAMNFGDESGAPIKSWVFRATLIQGTQQIYVAALWFWGDKLSEAQANNETWSFSNTWKMAAVCLPLALLCFIVGVLMAVGLPDYYRQAPGKIPSFYRSVWRRKVVVWFFIAVYIQNLFLSAPYGRNWKFLWSSDHATAWQVAILVFFFFIVVWALFLYVFSLLAREHSWIVPIFAIGLGAPRWAQIWWGTSNIGLYVPWAHGYVFGALVSRSLWLWLGVLDAVQGVGFGMILLQTLTRVHVCFTLLAAQVIGSIGTIMGRALAPNKLGPGPISPDISLGASAILNAWFFIALILQLLICVGFLMFFRKEQLSKP